MNVSPAAIPEVLVVSPRKHGDHRGFFSETFRADWFKPFGIDLAWVQDNHSMSVTKGVLRGLHFQSAPMAQAKLIRVVRGAILDVAVDIRCGSPTYGQHVAVELSADNWKQLFVPVGFAHGFCTLADNTEVVYKVSAPYSPEHEGGLRWNDPALGVAWPVSPSDATLTERDGRWPGLADFVSPFDYDGAGAPATR
jgi:dTDP-4-dehydrorhamnose 3,5-epimerase